MHRAIHQSGNLRSVLAVLTPYQMFSVSEVGRTYKIDLQHIFLHNLVPLPQ